MIGHGPRGRRGGVRAVASACHPNGIAQRRDGYAHDTVFVTRPDGLVPARHAAHVRGRGGSHPSVGPRHTRHNRLRRAVSHVQEQQLVAEHRVRRVGSGERTGEQGVPVGGHALEGAGRAEAGAHGVPGDRGVSARPAQIHFPVAQLEDALRETHEGALGDRPPDVQPLRRAGRGVHPIAVAVPYLALAGDLDQRDAGRIEDPLDPVHPSGLVALAGRAERAAEGDRVGPRPAHCGRTARQVR